MTDNTSENTAGTLTAEQMRQRDFDSLGGAIRTNVRPRGSFARASNNPAEYGDQTTGSKMLINLLLMLTQLIDPSNKSNGGLISMFSKAFGFDDDAEHSAFRDLRDKVAKDGREKTREGLDYSRFDRSAASDALRQGEKQLVKAAAGKNIYSSPLLEMIGKHESGNDYNRIYVPPRMPGESAIKRVDVSNMTVNQVLAYQKDWTNQQRAAGIPADRCSSAIGKYQFIRGTLESTAKQMGLSGNEKFTPELQDRMAMHQLKNAGYDKFVAGKTNESAFLNKVAGVWSSIPKTNGQSAHAGIGINAAGTTVTAAITTLRSERNAVLAAVDKAETTKGAFAAVSGTTTPAIPAPAPVSGDVVLAQTAKPRPATFAL